MTGSSSPSALIRHDPPDLEEAEARAELPREMGMAYWLPEAEAARIGLDD